MDKIIKETEHYVYVSIYNNFVAVYDLSMTNYLYTIQITDMANHIQHVFNKILDELDSWG